MKALSTQKSSNDSSKRKPIELRYTPTPKVSDLSPLATRTTVLHRKPRCSCGGGCPRCQETALIQTKLKIGELGDQYEQEADRIADEVMQMPEPAIQRQVEPGEEEEETIQTKAIANPVTPSSQNQESSQVPPIVHEVLYSPGYSLDPETRSFMESRFGHDFSSVRVHTDAKAVESAHAVDARAYTLGQNIVFGIGQYAPGTPTGQKLLAHELAHVVQQSHQPTPAIQRMARGSGTPPTGWSHPGGGTFTLAVVPAKDVARVDEAIEMVREVATNPKKFSACHEFFQRRCPNASPKILQQIFNRAQIWKLMNPSSDELARGDVNGQNIAYSQSGYNQGTRGLAETLMHELGHNCGIPGDSTHYRAEMAAAYCMGQGRNQVLLQYAFNDQTFMAFLTYRRILAELGAGHFRLTVGGDWNYAGTIAEVVNLKSPQSRTKPSEFASAMIGVQGRTTLGGRLGAERFGGLFGRIETGFGAGRFLLREPRLDETTDIYGSYVLQLGGGVEFLIPNNPHVFPLSIEAGYRLTQPLTSEARQIHTFSLGVTIPF